jgi:ParB family transcriptional regulator, chromosome partitioning protein
VNRSALFIQSRLALKETQQEIAKQLCKSQAFVAYVCALIDAPAWLVDLYRSGRCRGVTELYQLRRLHALAPDQVERFVQDRECVTRTDVNALKATIPMQAEGQGAPVALQPAKPQAPAPNPTRQRSSPTAPSINLLNTDQAPDHMPLVLLASLQGEVCEIALDRRPDAPQSVYVRKQGDAMVTVQVQAKDLTLLGFR